MTTLTPEQCAREALQRLHEADAIFARYEDLPAEEQDEHHIAYSRASHLRQTAAVYATLALAGRYTLNRAGGEETLS